MRDQANGFACPTAHRRSAAEVTDVARRVVLRPYTPPSFTPQSGRAARPPSANDAISVGSDGSRASSPRPQEPLSPDVPLSAEPRIKRQSSRSASSPQSRPGTPPSATPARPIGARPSSADDPLGSFDRATRSIQGRGTSVGRAGLGSSASTRECPCSCDQYPGPRTGSPSEHPWPSWFDPPGGYQPRCCRRAWHPSAHRPGVRRTRFGAPTDRPLHLHTPAARRNVDARPVRIPAPQAASRRRRRRLRPRSPPGMAHRPARMGERKDPARRGPLRGRGHPGRDLPPRGFRRPW